MKEFIAVGDIAGRYVELLALLDKFPKNIPVISLGDPNDRGPNSKEVIEFFMSRPDCAIVQSNHAHMMIDFWERGNVYEEFIFLANGGDTTAESYGVEIPEHLIGQIKLIMRGYHTAEGLIEVLQKIENVRFDFHNKVPKAHIDYLKSCPLYIETDEVIMTHAPINPTLPLETEYGSGDMWSRGIQFFWNAGGSRRRDKFQLHGHMSFTKVRELKDSNGLYGLNMDTSSGKMLSAIHWPSMRIESVDYVTELGNYSIL